MRPALSVVVSRTIAGHGLRDMGISRPWTLPRLVPLFVRRSSLSSLSCASEDANSRPSPLHSVSGDAKNEKSQYAWDKLSERNRNLAETLLEGDPVTTTRGEVVGGAANHEKTSTWWKHRVALSQTITLAESQSLSKQEQAGWMLTYLLHQPVARRRRLQSFRLGIAGAPGAGKSTFIEALGKFLLDRDASMSTPGPDWFPRTMSVVCVDPTSSRSGGSILGDKTRMQTLSSGLYEGRSYVRPAPSGVGTLGGLSTYTHDVVTLCQVSGFELVVVESVGVGQSEVEIEQAVDMLLLLVPPAGGDDLQGVKKGIVEVSDLVVVTKADGNLLPAAKQTASDYLRAMPYVRSFYNHADVLPGWEQPKVVLVSSSTGDGLDKVWEQVSMFRRQLMNSHRLEEKRARQEKYWMWKNLQYLVRLQLQQDPNLQERSQQLRDQLSEGRTTPRVAAAQLLELYIHASQ